MEPVRIVTATIALGLAVPPAAAAALPGNDAVRFQRVLKANGYTFTTDKDREQMTYIKVKTAARSFSVYFYDCTNDRDCKSYQLSAGYDLTTPTTATKMNSWNAEKRYARGYIDDEGDPFVTVDVSMNAAGGTSDALLMDNVKWFEAVAAEFETFVGYRK